MRTMPLLAVLTGLLLLLCGCDAQREASVAAPAADRAAAEPSVPEQTERKSSEEEDAEPMLQMWIGDTAVLVDWEENTSVDALKELCRGESLTISMSMYGGFEQVGAIGTSLPRDDVQTVTKAGDIVLYAGNQIVVFYGSNAWAYTRLGHISDPRPEELTELLANGDVILTFRMEADR